MFFPQTQKKKIILDVMEAQHCCVTSVETLAAGYLLISKKSHKP